MSQGPGKWQRFIDHCNWILLSCCTLHFSNIHKCYLNVRNIFFSDLLFTGSFNISSACPFAQHSFPLKNVRVQNPLWVCNKTTSTPFIFPFLFYLWSDGGRNCFCISHNLNWTNNATSIWGPLCSADYLLPVSFLSFLNIYHTAMVG